MSTLETTLRPEEEDVRASNLKSRLTQMNSFSAAPRDAIKIEPPSALGITATPVMESYQGFGAGSNYYSFLQSKETQNSQENEKDYVSPKGKMMESPEDKRQATRSVKIGRRVFEIPVPNFEPDVVKDAEVLNNQAHTENSPHTSNLYDVEATNTNLEKSLLCEGPIATPIRRRRRRKKLRAPSSIISLPMSSVTAFSGFTVQSTTSTIKPKRSKLSLFLNSTVMFGREYCYAIEATLTTPILLSIGLPLNLYSLVWVISPILGFIFQPIVGNLSDKCKCRWGRRRPFILVLAILLLIGMTLFLNGEAIVGLAYGRSGLRRTFDDSSYVLAAILVTVAGVVVFDFSADFIEGPIRAYVMDVCDEEDVRVGLYYQAVFTGFGGAFGYASGGISWVRDIGLGRFFPSDKQVIYVFAAFIFVVCLALNLTSIREKNRSRKNRTRSLQRVVDSERRRKRNPKRNQHEYPSNAVVDQNRNINIKSGKAKDGNKTKRGRFRVETVTEQNNNVIDADGKQNWSGTPLPNPSPNMHIVGLPRVKRIKKSRAKRSSRSKFHGRKYSRTQTTNELYGTFHSNPQAGHFTQYSTPHMMNEYGQPVPFYHYGHYNVDPYVDLVPNMNLDNPDNKMSRTVQWVTNGGMQDYYSKGQNTKSNRRLLPYHDPQIYSRNRMPYDAYDSDTTFSSSDASTIPLPPPYREANNPLSYQNPYTDDLVLGDGNNDSDFHHDEFAEPHGPLQAKSKRGMEPGSVLDVVGSPRRSTSNSVTGSPQKYKTKSSGGVWKSIIGMTKELKCLCIAHLLGWIAFLCVVLFFTDFVGQEVYGGDPQAPPNSPRYEAYKRGVEMGSWGMTINAAASAVYCFLLKPMIQNFGAKIVYFMGYAAFATGSAVMAFYQHPYCVLALSPLIGVMSATLYTLPYFLVVQYHEGYKHLKGTPEERGVGIDCAFVTCMIQLAQIIVGLGIGALVVTLETVTVTLVAGSVTAIFGAIWVTFFVKY